MQKYKKNISLFIFLLFLGSCASLKKTHTTLSPEDLLNKYKTIKNGKCQAYEIQGIIYFFSKKQNFRCKFYLKGNKWFPWLMEIKSSFGTTIYFIKIEKNIVKILSVKEKKIYILNSKDILMYFGVKIKISPEFLFKVLTGEWKTFMSFPKEIKQLPKGVKYFFNDRLVKEVKLYYNQNRAYIWQTSYGGIDILNDSKIVLRDSNFGEVIFKIKQKKCVKDKFELDDLKLKIPSNVTQEVFIRLRREKD